VNLLPVLIGDSALGKPNRHCVNDEENSMKSHTWMSMTVVSLFAALVMPVCIAAQDNPSPDNRHKHHMYKLIDLGTFGGPISGFTSAPVAQVLNNSGIASGFAETTTPDPYAPNCFEADCLIAHAFRWKNNRLTDLGSLASNNNSFPNWINDRGVIVGLSENGEIDPTTGFPEGDAVLWDENGRIVDLGTFGGTQSQANGVNNRGQVVGAALNNIPDPFEASLVVTPFFYLMFPGTTQVHAFLWQNGVKQDLGTLGTGTDSVAVFVNRSGQVAGQSFTNSTPNQITDSCGTNVPTLDPFIWDRNTGMVDLGTLGGTCGFPRAFNNRGQVTGQSNLAGDVNFHAFLWTRGVMTDLGTLGGNTSSPRWMNDAGEVVGRADIPGSQTRHGFLWKRGVMTDLGVVAGDPCSTAYGINASGQIVGVSSPCGQSGHGFLWENGGPIVDLQTLVLPGSDLTIAEVFYINDRGEIAGFGTLPNGDQHALVLIPCDEKHPGECQDNSMIEVVGPRCEMPATQHSSPNNQDSGLSLSPESQLRNRLMQGYHIPGRTGVPTN
jgi:probable HAF family extracellular repeat protein